MDKWVISALIAVLLSVCPGADWKAEAKRPYPALKGLTKVKVDASVSEDVKVQLMHAGAPNFIVGSELQHEAENKLREAGISVGELSPESPRLAITADVDMSTDEFTLSLACYEPVSLLRDQSIKFETKVWSRSGHPQIDEAKALKAVLDDLVDQFIADRAEATPSK